MTPISRRAPIAQPDGSFFPGLARCGAAFRAIPLLLVVETLKTGPFFAVVGIAILQTERWIL